LIATSSSAAASRLTGFYLDRSIGEILHEHGKFNASKGNVESRQLLPISYQ